jgi:hypothetical protein
MTALLLTNPIQVVNRLNELGWKKEQLIEVVESMVAARNSCTENDPPGAPGWKSWCDGTRRLREIGSLLGWERNDDHQISSIYDSKRGIKIAVVNTDDGTGLEKRQPQNRSKKGAATDRAVSNNQELFGDILEQANNVIQLPKPNGGVVYWYLCVYCEGDTVRAELSCPLECENGFFKKFYERISLLGEEGDDEGLRIVGDSPSGGDFGFEINVTRKRA